MSTHTIKKRSIKRRSYVRYFTSLPLFYNASLRRFFSHFATSANVDNCSVNLANLGNAYYALTDAAIAHRIDGETLEQKSFIYFGDILNVSMSAAHPHYGNSKPFAELKLRKKRAKMISVISRCCFI